MSLSNGKSPGIENISFCIIKIAYPKIMIVLLYLLNLSFEKGVFPDILKTVVVDSLNKSGPIICAIIIDQLLFSLHLQKYLKNK